MGKFIVVYDDEMGLCIPLPWADDCDGAVGGFASPVALFDTKGDARTAITISRCFARLQQAQGKPANTDFLDSPTRIKIRKAETR